MKYSILKHKENGVAPGLSTGPLHPLSATPLPRSKGQRMTFV